MPFAEMDCNAIFLLSTLTMRSKSASTRDRTSSTDDGGGIAIHSGALQALGDDLKVNIKVFVEGEEEMGSPSFIPFIEEHKDEFDSDVIIVADSGNWSAEIPSLTTSLLASGTGCTS